MIQENYELFEIIGLNFLFALFFFFIGMAIKDVLNQAKVPKFGRQVVWLVLFLGCFGFICKGMIQIFWQTTKISNQVQNATNTPGDSELTGIFHRK